MTQPLRILLVEDDQLDAELIERTLRKGGLLFETRRVDDRDGLVAALEAFRPRVVLSDYNLPRYDGGSALEEVRRRDPILPFLFVSGAMGEERAVESLRRGASDYILKNNLARLPSAVERALEEASRKAALRQSEERFRTLVETTSDWIWEVDAQGRYTYASPQSLALLGLAPEELLGRTPFDLMDEEEAIRVRTLLDPIIAARRPIQLLENAVRHKDGHLVILETVGTPIFGPDGAFAGYRGSDRDITERKQIQATLAAEHSRLRTLLDTIPDLVCLKDPNGIFLACNPPFEHFLGAEETDIVGRSDYDFVDPELADFFRAHDQEAMESGRPSLNMEWLTFRSDGQRRLMETIKTPMSDPDGTLVGVLGVARDITALHQAQAVLETHQEELKRQVAARTAELEEAEARLQLILDSSADGIFGVDREEVVAFINPAGCAILGYRQEELIGRRIHETIHHSREDGKAYPFAESAIYATLTQGVALRREDEYYWHSDGHAIPVAYATHPMIRDNEVVGAVVSFNEIGARREAEAAREAALKEATRLAKVRSEFLANMSHEIRTPLNSVLGFAQVGRRDSAGRKVEDTFDKILEAGQLLMGVLNDILDFSKIEAGKMRLEQETIALHRLLRSTAEMVCKQVEAKGVAFNLEIADEMPTSCKGDALRLRQVLLNLLGNAVKFTDRGDITLAARREGDDLMFQVADTGIGMAQAQVAQLFRPFEQVDGSITRRFGGTGLGLSISKRLADLMGGGIRVESRPGQGSLFELRLPYTPGREESLESDPEGVSSRRTGDRLSGLSILAAEDNAVNRMMLEELLSGEGCRLTLVENGRDAVNLVRDSSPFTFDVVLMDVQMPEMDGYEATRLIRELAPGLPVIGLTAYAMDEACRLCKAAGMVDRVAKPIVLERLVAAILRHAPGGTADERNIRAEESATPSVEADEDRADIDWPLLEEAYAERKAFFHRLLDVLLHHNIQLPDALRRAAHAANLEQLSRISHSLKGTGGDILPPAFRSLAAQVEAAARMGRSREGIPLALRLAKMLDEQVWDIAGYLEKNAASSLAEPEIAVDWEKVVEYLSRLETLLSNDDTAANTLIREARPMLTAAFGDCAAKLEGQINLFDYPNAFLTVRELLTIVADARC